MATQVQIRRDTTANLALATPVAGELGYDTTRKGLVVGDGSTAGGIVIPNAAETQKQTHRYAAGGGTGDDCALAAALLLVDVARRHDGDRAVYAAALAEAVGDVAADLVARLEGAEP